MNKRRIEQECSGALATVCAHLKDGFSFQHTGNRIIKWEFLSEPRIYKCSVSQAFDMELIRDLTMKFHICVTTDTENNTKIYINDDEVSASSRDPMEAANRECVGKIRTSFEGIIAALVYQ